MKKIIGIILIVVGVICLIGVIGGGSSDTKYPDGPSLPAITEDSNDYKPTLGESNALRSAKQYLRTLAFSYEGLRNQLLFEGYSEAEATYGVDNCGANWNEQCLRKAKEYLNVMGFSKEGLIDQLKFEKFTSEQIEYAIAGIGYN